MVDTSSWQELQAIGEKILARAHPGVSVAIDPDDDMFNYSLQNLGRSEIEAWTDYFDLGRHTLDVLTTVLHWAGRDWKDVGSFLDFAAGYGRSTRFMQQVLPPDAIWASDILAPAVAFQRREFKVNGFVSETDPDRVEFPREFDVISVISLFTHLPEPAFHAWLAKLTGSLAPNGILILTSHGMQLLGARFWWRRSAPFRFEARSESGVLDRESYGNTHCTRQFIEQSVERLPGVSLLAHIPKGLNGHQDVTVLARDVAPPAEECLLPPPSVGVHIDVAKLDAASTLRLEGWALDENLGNVEQVEVLADGQRAGVAALGVERPDVAEHFGEAASSHAGWRFEAPSLATRPRWIAAIAKSASGSRRVRLVRLADA